MAFLSTMVRLGRPQFLVGGFLLYALGATVSLAAGGATAGARPLDWTSYLLGQAAITSIQLMTHYGNDYFDQAADLANTTPTRWSGGSRILPAGAVPPAWALRAALLFATVALVITGTIAARAWGTAAAPLAAGWALGGQARPPMAGWAVPTLLLAQALAWFYSAPPLVLHSRGLGELTTALVVTGLTPLCGFLLQAAPPQSGGATLARALGNLGAILWPLVGLQFAMLLAIEFPDRAGDALVGKRTLVVRWGGAGAAAVYRAVLIAVYGALPVLALAGAPRLAMLAAALSLPVAAWQFWSLGRGHWDVPRRWEGMAFRGVALLVGTTAAELVAMVWSLGRGGS